MVAQRRASAASASAAPAEAPIEEEPTPAAADAPVLSEAEVARVLDEMAHAEMRRAERREREESERGDDDAAPPAPLGLTHYLRQASAIPLPTAEHERALAAVIQDASRADEERRRAVGDLCAGHLRWVVALAKRFRERRETITLSSRFSLDDFIAAGNVGLTYAAWKFDGSHRFSTYATAWIWREMQRECELTGDATRFPWYLYSSVARLRRVWPLRARWTAEELAEETGVPIERVRLIYPWLAGAVNLSMHLIHGDAESSQYADFLAEPGSDPLEQLTAGREGTGPDARMILRYLLDPARDLKPRRARRVTEENVNLTWRERRVLAVRYRLRLPLSWLLPTQEERRTMLAEDYERVYWETLRWLGVVATERARGTYADGDPRPPLNLDEAALFVGVSRQRVSQIELHALSKLRTLAERLGVTAREVL